MEIKIIYEDENVLAVDKPAGIVTADLINRLSKRYPGLKKVHRLDKDTSGVLLTARNEETLIFLQKQYKNRSVEKKYIALVTGNLKNESGRIETLIGRSAKDRRKQKVYLPFGPASQGKREAITEYKVKARLRQGYGGQERYYTLLEVFPKTGRKHQIRCHLSYLGYPVAGDKIYGFKNSALPRGLTRQFLHASELKIKMPGKEIKEFRANLAKDLELCLTNLKKKFPK